MCLSPHPEDELPSPAAPIAPVLPPGVPLAGRVEEVPITAGRTGLVVIVVVVVVVSAVIVVVISAVIVVVVIAPAVVIVVVVIAALSHGWKGHCRRQQH